MAVTTTGDTSLLKDALAKAMAVLMGTYTNQDENPDAELPWEDSYSPLGLAKSSPEYGILVATTDGNIINFRGFVSAESAKDALNEARAALAGGQ